MTVHLSICIATLNRAAFIGATLESIATQLPEGVEVVVLDGASTDNTQSIVESFQPQIPTLRYIRQGRNSGVDRDFNTAVELASGTYVWLMSDDDLVKPGVLAALMAAVREEYSLIVLNAEVRTLDLSQELDGDRLRFGENRTYAPAQFFQLFEDTSAYLTYIGAVVMRRELWLARDRESYFGSYFIHVGVIFQAPLPGPSLVIAAPCISIRFGNTQWRPKEFEIRMIRWTRLIWSLPAIPDVVRGRLYRKDPWRSLKSLVFYRAKGTYSLTEYRKWVAPELTSSLDALKAVSVACLPGVIANLIGLCYCSLPYQDSKIHFLDMKASRFYPGRWFKRKS